MSSKLERKGIRPRAIQFSPAPRTVYPRWESIAGPNFQYFLHVAWFLLLPLFFGAWSALVFSWAAFGQTVEGRFSYSLVLPNNGIPPQDQMQVEYHLGNLPQVLVVNLGDKELQQLGMPTESKVVPGQSLLTTAVPVRVLQIGSWHYAEAIFPWTWIWRRLIPPLFLAILSAAALIILHGDMFETIRRSFRLVRHGVATDGTFLGTHETGWWESSGEYRWTYIRRCYVDYAFVGPDGHERRGCQLVLGSVDPALMTEESRTIILYNPDDPQQHVMYKACAFRAKAT